MKNTPILLIALLLLLGACDKNRTHKNSEGSTPGQHTQETGPFNELSLQGNYEVLLILADEPRVDIDASEELLEHISISNSGGKLSIITDEDILQDDAIKITVYYTDLDYIICGGAATLRNEGFLKSHYLQIDMQGAGLFELDIETNTCDVEIAGAGIVRLRGNTNLIKCSIDGAGNLGAYDLFAQDADIRLSGVGGAQVTVEGTLDARVSGMGGIGYRGNPEKVNSQVSGLGAIFED